MDHRYPIKKTWWKRYDGVNILKWNFEVKPFVVWYVVSIKKRHMWTEGDTKSHAILKCCWKEKMLLENESVVNLC